MIRQLRAFGWLRWRLLLNGVRGSRRRDTLEQISRVLALAAPAAIVVLSLGSVAALSLGGFLAGRAFASGAAISDAALLIIRGALLVQMLLVVFMPLGLGTQSSAKYARFLLLPISRRVLHGVEVLAGIADPWIFVVLPGLVLLAIGVLSAGNLPAAVVALLAGAGFAAVVLALSALVTFLAAWLMRDRRRAELMTLLFVLAISLAALLPHLFSENLERRGRAARAEGRPRPTVTVARVESVLPAWTRALPSEMYGRAVSASAMQGRPLMGVAWVAGLWAQALVVYLLSGVVYQRLLDAGEGQARRTQGSPAGGLPRVPFLSPAASAVAATQFRTGLKSVRGRLAVLLPGPMLALLALVISRTPEEAEWIAQIPGNGHLVFGASLIFSIYAVQPFTMNQFASDRAGLTLQFLLPVSARELVWGKAAGTFALFGAAALLALLVTAISTGFGSPLLWLSTIVGGCATFLLLTPVAAAVSAVLPVAADLSKTGSGGNPHGAAMLVGTFLVLLAAAPAALILLIGPRAGQVTTVALSALWLLIVAAIVIPLLGWVANLVTSRRENLYLTKA